MRTRGETPRLLLRLRLPCSRAGVCPRVYIQYRWNHADTDQFQKLPIWEQLTVGRMYTYDSTMTRLPTSGQIGVNDLVASLSGIARGGGRLRALDFQLGALYMLAGQPNFRAAVRLITALQPSSTSHLLP